MKGIRLHDALTAYPKTVEDEYNEVEDVWIEYLNEKILKYAPTISTQFYMTFIDPPKTPFSVNNHEARMAFYAKLSKNFSDFVIEESLSPYGVRIYTKEQKIKWDKYTDEWAKNYNKPTTDTKKQNFIQKLLGKK